MSKTLKRLALTFFAYMAVIVAGTLLANVWSPLYGQLVLGAVCLLLLIRLLSSQRLELALHERIDTYRKKAHILKDKAYSDSLTGLANRLLLADRFDLTATRSKRQGTPFALLMIDLNAFKAINDNYGHAAGDQVLVTVAKRLLETVRASDTVARVGGDEFVLLIESFKNPDELVHLGRKLVTNADSNLKCNFVINRLGGRDVRASLPLDRQVKVALNDLYTPHPRRTLPDCHPC